MTSLGLVQMTRKRIGTGLLEAFSETCEHCQGRGVIVHQEPVEPKSGKAEDEQPRRSRRGRGRGRGDDQGGQGLQRRNGSHGPWRRSGKQSEETKETPPRRPTPAEFAAMARAESAAAEKAAAETAATDADEPSESTTEQPEAAAEPDRRPEPTAPEPDAGGRRVHARAGGDGGAGHRRGAHPGRHGSADRDVGPPGRRPARGGAPCRDGDHRRRPSPRRTVTGPVTRPAAAPRPGEALGDAVDDPGQSADDLADVDPEVDPEVDRRSRRGRRAGTRPGQEEGRPQALRPQTRGVLTVLRVVP